MKWSNIWRIWRLKQAWTYNQTAGNQLIPTANQVITGGPPLTRFSLLRNPLPRFLSYVRASYSDFGLKYFFFSSNKATNPDNNSPKEKTESTDDEGGPAKTTLNPIYIPPKTSKVISSIMGKIEMAKNIHLQMGIVFLFQRLPVMVICYFLSKLMDKHCQRFHRPGSLGSFFSLALKLSSKSH